MKTLKKSLATLALLSLAAAASAQIKVENAWVRATVPKQQATGAFMKITSSETVKLMAVTSAVAKTNEIHEMKLEGDVMKMRAHPNGLEIPANTTVELKSGGYHVMMMELDKAIKAGDVVPLQLEFTDAKGKKQTLTVNAKAGFKNPYSP
ncbi:copper chaperone PCu(A)C (plasmid) [Polaromonas sp. P1-6]|nr:copper chaperone PCu(A)C [Polaromonas sp. P1-6]